MITIVNSADVPALTTAIYTIVEFTMSVQARSDLASIDLVDRKQYGPTITSNHLHAGTENKSARSIASLSLDRFFSSEIY